MSERLRPRDLAFLAAESPTTPHAQRDGRDLRPGRLRLRLRPPGRADRRPDRVRAALPPAAAAGAGPAGQPGLGRRRRTSTSATTYAAPRCRVPGPMDQLRELVARIVSRPLDRSRPLWEVYFVEGLAERPGRAALQDPPDPGRRRRDRRPRPGAARHRRPTAQALGHDDVAPAPAAVAGRRCALGAVHRHRSTSPRTRGRHRPRQRRVACAPAEAVRDRAGARSPTRSPAAARSTRSPVTGQLSQQRRFVTVRTELADYRTIRERARRHRQRRHPGHPHRRPARLADDPRRVDGRAAHDQGDRADVGDRRRARGHLARHPDHRPLRRPADRRAQPGRPAAPGRPTPSRPTRRPAAASSAPTGSPGIAGFAPDDVPRARARGSPPPSCAAASTSSITNVPGPQFPLYAAGARMLETYPVHPLLPGHALAIGVTSYDGGVFYGITADRDARARRRRARPVRRSRRSTSCSTRDRRPRPRAPRGRKKTSSRRREP